MKKEKLLQKKTEKNVIAQIANVVDDADAFTILLMKAIREAMDTVMTVANSDVI